MLDNKVSRLSDVALMKSRERIENEINDASPRVREMVKEINVREWRLREALLKKRLRAVKYSTRIPDEFASVFLGLNERLQALEPLIGPTEVKARISHIDSEFKDIEDNLVFFEIGWGLRQRDRTANALPQLIKTDKEKAPPPVRAEPPVVAISADEIAIVAGSAVSAVDQALNSLKPYIQNSSLAAVGRILSTRFDGKIDSGEAIEKIGAHLMPGWELGVLGMVNAVLETLASARVRNEYSDSNPDGGGSPGTPALH